LKSLSVQQFERRLAALELKKRQGRCGECAGKPCPANLDCPLVFFDQLIQEAERRRQEGDLEFVRMAAKVIGIDC
jgi:hypothetical protein